MEKALVVSLAGPAPGADLRRYDRVYLGSNFCQELLPRGRDLEAVLKAGAKAVTLATPLLTGAALAAFLGELKGLLRLAPRLEVSCNDLGLAEGIRKKFGGKVPLSLGRPISIDFIRMEKAALAKFLRGLGFGWLESDEADMVRQLPAGFPVPVAFHYPLKYKAMSRLCPRTGRMNSGGCGRPCGAGAFEISPPDGSAKLTVFENGYFERNRPSADRHVQRLVRTPGV